MSTRSQVLFIVKTKWKGDDGKPQERLDQALIYRHSDGYPEGMIPDLIEFLKWNAGRNSDLEYMAANWIFWYKRKMEEYMTEDKFGIHKGWKWSEPDGNNSVKLGMGVCTLGEYHGDIEYFYKVILEQDYNKSGAEKLTIEVFDPNTRGEKTTIPEKPFATVSLDPETVKVKKIVGLTKDFKQKDEEEED